MRTLMIIGSSGFLGRSLVRHCRRIGVRTVGIDRPGTVEAVGDRPDAFLEADVAADLRSLPERVDVAVFAAQGPSRRVDDPEVGELFRVNAAGVARTLALLRAAGGVPLLHCSTGSVYLPAWGPIPESATVRFDEPYALSKLHAEAMASMHAGHVPVVNVRIFGLYGPFQRHRMLPGIAGRVRRGEPVQLAAGPAGCEDGGLRISLLHVDDAAAAFVELGRRVLDRAHVPGVLNMASDDAPSIRDMATAFGRLLGTEPVFVRGPARQGDLVADTSALARVVASRRRPFAEGLAHALDDDPTLGAA